MLNSLNLVEFLLKNGSAKFKAELEDETFMLRKFRNYQEDEEEDLNAPVQTITQRILALMDDPEELKRAREEAQKLKERIRGFSSELETRIATYDEDPKYGGISSDSLGKTRYDNSNDVNLARRLGLQGEDSPNASPTRKPEPVEEKPKPVAKPADDEDFLGLTTESKANDVKEKKKSQDEEDFLGLKAESQGDVASLGAKVDNLDLLSRSTPTEKPKKTGKLLPPPPKKKQAGNADLLTSVEEKPQFTEPVVSFEPPATQKAKEPENPVVKTHDPHDLILF